MLSGKQYNFGAEAFSDVSVFSLLLIPEKYSAFLLRLCHDMLLVDSML